jgi:hypothetical protein
LPLESRSMACSIKLPSLSLFRRDDLLDIVFPDLSFSSLSSYKE